MYWLLDFQEQDRIREIILRLNKKLARSHNRVQSDQTFPFVGRKDRGIAIDIIEELSPDNGTVCDPFAGSGTFAYAAVDAGRNIIANEWEPYAHELMSAPFVPLPSLQQYRVALDSFISKVRPKMEEIYETTCPQCGKRIMFDGLFFDRDPEEYFNPTVHDRMGKGNRENIIFRPAKYKCSCGCN